MSFSCADLDQSAAFYGNGFCRINITMMSYFFLDKHNPVAINSQVPQAPFSVNFNPQELFSTQRENYVQLNLNIMKGQWTDKICLL